MAKFDQNNILGQILNKICGVLGLLTNKVEILRLCRVLVTIVDDDTHRW